LVTLVKGVEVGEFVDEAVAAEPTTEIDGQFTWGRLRPRPAGAPSPCPR
jgi:hypothetical protein